VNAELGGPNPAPTAEFANRSLCWGIPYPAGQDLGRAPMTMGKAPAAAELLTISIEDTRAGGTLHIDWGTTRASISFTIG
jgi:hypothetical protein